MPRITASSFHYPSTSAFSLHTFAGPQAWAVQEGPPIGVFLVLLKEVAPFGKPAQPPPPCGAQSTGQAKKEQSPKTCPKEAPGKGGAPGSVPTSQVRLPEKVVVKFKPRRKPSPCRTGEEPTLDAPPARLPEGRSP